jgi:hypothetical protein
MMLIAAAALLALAAAVASSGSVELDRAGAASWSRPCASRPARPDRLLLARCARVSGHVVWTRRGAHETHLAVLADFHLLVVKLLPDVAAPGRGSSLTAIGPLVRARNGLREVQAFALSH